MADLPISFSSPMVQALLADLKTQTRRGLRIRGHKTFSEFGRSDTLGYHWHFRDAGMRWHDLRHEGLLVRLPYKVGDRLYVREAWRTWGGLDAKRPSQMWSDEDVRYEADKSWNWPRHPRHASGRYRQAMHMPRWASRLTLTVTDVRVQRLQEISEADAVAEGSQEPSLRDLGGDLAQAAWCERQVFQRLWNSLHGPEAWDQNPWVAAYSFTVQHGNIDQIGGGNG